MQKITQFLLVLMIGLLMTSADAMIMSDLNEVTVAVPNQSEQALQQALPIAFARALVRVSGNAEVMTLPQMQNAVSDINKYVQSYGFFTKTTSQNEKKIYVKVTFDQQALLNLLQQAGQSIWNRDRPVILVWLKLNQNQNNINNTFIASMDNSNVLQDLKKQAQQRGIPIMLPTMDLQDQSYINSNSTKIFDMNKLQQIVARYHTNGILAGTVNQDEQGNWVGQWLLLFNDQPLQWSITAKQINVVIGQAMDRMADLLSNQLSTLDNEKFQSLVKLEVKGVNNLHDYVKLMRYLKSLTPVTVVNVNDMDNATIFLDVKVAGGVMSLADALQGSRLLSALPIPQQTDHNQLVNLYYKWNNQISTMQSAPNNG